jgi:hypothetical protein
MVCYSTNSIDPRCKKYVELGVIRGIETIKHLMLKYS